MRKLTAKEVVEVSGGLAPDCGPRVTGFFHYLITGCIICIGGDTYC